MEWFMVVRGAAAMLLALLLLQCAWVALYGYREIRNALLVAPHPRAAKIELAVGAMVTVFLAYLSVPLFTAVYHGVEETLRAASR